MDLSQFSHTSTDFPILNKSHGENLRKRYKLGKFEGCVTIAQRYKALQNKTFLYGWEHSVNLLHCAT